MRINAVGTPWCLDDLLTVVGGAGGALDSIIVPKVEEVAQIHFVDRMLEQLEIKHGLERRIAIEVQIESPRGLVEVERIAVASARIEALIFGPGDYAAQAGMPQLTVGVIDETYPGDVWHYVLARLVTTARACRLQAIDGPYAAIQDRDGFTEAARRSRLLGFDGKWAIHLDQIELCNAIYAPTQDEFDRAERILASYRVAVDSDGRGATLFEGEMIDEASRTDMARPSILASWPRGRHGGGSVVSPAPLADVCVLAAVEQFGAGPWGTLQLADLGAEVIKIEDPTTGGDVGRYVPPYQEQESSLYFETFNRNKRSVSLDLRHPRSREVFENLVSECDAVFSNLRGDQPAKLGLRYRDLEHVNPRIVCCSLSGFGMDGPRAREGAYDWTMQGLAGWQSLTGDPDAPPTKSGLSLADYCGGYVAAIAILAGVWRARRDGRGADVDLSLFETALAQLTYLGTWVGTRGYEPVRRAHSAHQSIVPFQNFETSDGFVVVACPKQSLWEQLCRAIDRPDLLADERFTSYAIRDRHRDVLLPALEAVFRTRPTSEWIELLAAAGVPSAPVNDVAGALADPQVAARNALIEISHPLLGPMRQIASPLRIDGFEPPTERGPFRGEHTRVVLRELCGYSQSRIDELEDAGVFGELPLEQEVAT